MLVLSRVSELLNFSEPSHYSCLNLKALKQDKNLHRPVLFGKQVFYKTVSSQTRFLCSKPVLTATTEKVISDNFELSACARPILKLIPDDTNILEDNEPEEPEELDDIEEFLEGA